MPLHVCMAPISHVYHERNAQKRSTFATNTVTPLKHFENLPATNDGRIIRSSAIKNRRKYRAKYKRSWYQNETKFLSVLKLTNDYRCIRHLSESKEDRALPSLAGNSYQQVLFSGNTSVYKSFTSLQADRL